MSLPPCLPAPGHTVTPQPEHLQLLGLHLMLLSAPQTHILRTATSGLTILLLPDLGVERVYFSEDDRRKGRPSSHTYQHCLSSHSSGHLEQEH